MINVVAVDDQKYHLSLVSELLNDHQEINLVGTARTDVELFRLLKHNDIDVVLLDVEMPSSRGKDGTQIAKELLAVDDNIKIICLSINTQSHVLRLLLENIKVHGYLDKNETDKEEIIDSIYSVIENPSAIPFISQNLKKKVKRILNDVDVPVGIASLTKREKEILPFIAKGMSNGEIVMEIVNQTKKQLSVKTIDNHRTNIYQKLECSNAAQVGELYFNYVRLHSDDTDEVPNFKKEGRLPK